MTQQEKRDLVGRVTWQFVALAAVLGGFFLGIFVLIPDDMTDARTALLGLLTTSVAAVVGVLVQRGNQKTEAIGQQVRDQDAKLETIRRQTNGLSDEERQDIAERAAAEVVRQFRGSAR